MYSTIRSEVHGLTSLYFNFPWSRATCPTPSCTLQASKSSKCSANWGSYPSRTITPTSASLLHRVLKGFERGVPPNAQKTRCKSRGIWSTLLRQWSVWIKTSTACGPTNWDNLPGASCCQWGPPLWHLVMSRQNGRIMIFMMTPLPRGPKRKMGCRFST